MEIFISIALIMMSAIAFTCGVGLYLKNRVAKSKVRYYVISLSAASSVWCLCYGFIGLYDNLAILPYIRMIGVIALVSFILIDFIFVSGMNGADAVIKNLSRGIIIVVGLIDMVVFSNPGVNNFYRVGNHTTWSVGEDLFPHNFHLLFLALAAFMGIIQLLIWNKNVKTKKEKRFIVYIFFGNLLLLLGAIPDTILPYLGYYGLATSGIFSALATVVIWRGATFLSQYEIGLQNLVDHVIEFIDAGIAVFDLNKNLVLTNPYFDANIAGNIKKAGYSLSDSFEIEETKILDIIEKAGEGVCSTNCKLRDTDRWMSVRTTLAHDSFGEPFCYIFVISDITELVLTGEKLKEADAAKTKFLTMISHEIRTPINAILGFDEMIVRSSKNTEVLHSADNIQRAGNRLLNIINDILDMSKIESGSMSINPVDYNLHDCISEAFIMLVPKADEKDLVYTINNNPNIPKILYGDNIRIEQILINLINNAIKYTEKGFVSVDVDFAKVDDSSIKLCIEIADSGMGIKEENLSDIFEPFKRVEETKTRSIEGTGVGLPTAKYLAELMGGSITVRSEYASGSTFRLEIPQKIVDETPVGDINSSLYESGDVFEIKTSFVAPTGKILVVDDSDMNLCVVVGLLKHTKVKIDTVSDGFEALTMIRENKYDLILMDHMMPLMDGIDVLKRVKSDDFNINADTPIIVMTANAIEGAKEMYLEAGFTDYIMKPVTVDVLENALKQYFDPSIISYEINDLDVETEKEQGKKIRSLSMLPRIEGIDWKEAFSISPDIDLLNSVVAAFYNNSGKDLAELKKYYEGMDDPEVLDLYRIKVHALKHCAGLIGNSALHGSALALEMHAREKDRAFLKANHDSFVISYRQCAEDLCKAFTGAELNFILSSQGADTNELKTDLNSLKEVLEAFDTDGLNDLISEMNLKQYPGEYAETVKEIIQVALDLDIDGFMDKINELNLE